MSKSPEGYNIFRLKGILLCKICQ